MKYKYKCQTIKSGGVAKLEVDSLTNTTEKRTKYLAFRKSTSPLPYRSNINLFEVPYIFFLFVWFEIIYKYLPILSSLKLTRDVLSLWELKAEVYINLTKVSAKKILTCKILTSKKWCLHGSSEVRPRWQQIQDQNWTSTRKNKITPIQ